MTASDLVLPVELAAPLFMARVSWAVQILNYPPLTLAVREELPGHEIEHTGLKSIRRTAAYDD